MTKLWLCLLVLALAACGGSQDLMVCGGDCMLYHGEPFTYRADKPALERFF